MNYWSDRIEALARRIRRSGWRVTFREMPKAYGHCDYIRREIVIDSASSALQAFMTLCHEAGHRKAFILSRCRTWKKFQARNPSAKFRELQAIIYGWEYLKQYTDRIPQSRWVKENRSAL